MLWPDCSALANVGLDDFALFEQRMNAYTEKNETTEELMEKKNCYRTERSLRSFERRISLPAETQVDKAKAAFKDGLLEIKIPKSEEAKKKQRKINIE